MKNNKTMMHTRGNPSPSTTGPMPPQLLHSTHITSKRYAGAPTRLSRARSIPFLPALLRMVANGDVLFDDGKLILEKPDSFASRVLPRFFRHANLSSFRRQLNNFGFQKITVKDRIECHVFYNDELKGQHPEAILDLHRRSSTAKSPAKAIRKKRQFSKHDLVQPKDASGLSSSSTPSISLEEQAETTKDCSDVTQRGVSGTTTRETTSPRSEYEGAPPPEKKSKRYPCREDLRRNTTAIADDVLTRDDECADDDPAVWNLPSGDEPLQPFVILSPPQAVATSTICDSLSPVDDRERFGFRGWQSPRCDKGKNDEGQVEADDSRAEVLVACGSAYDDEEVRPASPAPREFDEDCWNGKEESGSGDLEHLVEAVVQSDFESGHREEGASTILQQPQEVHDDTRMHSTELDHNEGDQVFTVLGDDRAFSEDSDESDEAAAAASTAVATTYPGGETPLSASHSFFSVGGLFRPSFRYEDADFGGKNFGDSILGECRVVDGEEDWNPFYDVTITDGFPTVRRRYSTGAEPEVCMSDRTNDACEPACAQYKSSNSSTQAGQGVFLDSDLRVMTRNKCGATWSPELLPKTSSPLPPCRPTISWVSSRVGR